MSRSESEFVLMTIERANIMSSKVRSYERRARSGNEVPGEREALAAEVWAVFGPKQSQFFAKHGRLAPTYKGVLGWPATWSEQRHLKWVAFVLLCAAWVISLSSLMQIGFASRLDAGPKFFVLTAVSGLAAVLITLVALWLGRFLKPSDLAQREADYAEYYGQAAQLRQQQRGAQRP